MLWRKRKELLLERLQDRRADRGQGRRGRAGHVRGHDPARPARAGRRRALPARLRRARSRRPRPPRTTRAGRRSRTGSKARVAAACLELIRPRQHADPRRRHDRARGRPRAAARPRRHGDHAQPDDRGRARRPSGRGLHPRRAPVQALRRRVRRRRGRGRGAGHRRPVPDGRHGRAAGHGADDRRRRRGGDEAHALAPRGRDLGDGVRGEDRRGVAVPGARRSTRSRGSSATPTRSTRCWPSSSARACGCLSSGIAPRLRRPPHQKASISKE